MIVLDAERPPMLTLFVVYHDPSDYPGQYVVRAQTLARDGHIAPEPVPRAVVATLSQARAALPIGLTFIPRDPNDDPAIVEVWL